MTAARRAALALCACLISLGGCGGDDEAAVGAGENRGGVAPELRQVVRLAEPGSEPSETVEVEDGDVVSVTTRVVNAEAAQGGEVLVTLPRAIEGSGTVGASGGNAGVQTTVEARGGGSLEVEDVRWVCRVPPGTFCPASTAREGSDGYEVTFPVPPEGVPIVVSFTVASTPGR